MLQLDIPGHGLLRLQNLVLDYNGTLALDGTMFKTVKDCLNRLSEHLDVHVLTSDTFGTVVEQCKSMPVQVKVLESADHTAEKASYITQLGSQYVVAVGNGANDSKMLEQASLGIVVLGPEGCSGRSLVAADVVVSRIEDALGLLLYPQRLIATLRR